MGVAVMGGWAATGPACIRGGLKGRDRHRPTRALPTHLRLAARRPLARQPVDEPALHLGGCAVRPAPGGVGVSFWFVGGCAWQAQHCSWAAERLSSTRCSTPRHLATAIKWSRVSPLLRSSLPAWACGGQRGQRQQEGGLVRAGRACSSRTLEGLGRQGRTAGVLFTHLQRRPVVRRCQHLRAQQRELAVGQLRRMGGMGVLEVG